MPRGVLTAPLGAREVPGSPYRVRVLREGHCTPRGDGTFWASGSITLVWGGGRGGGPITLLMDTGGPWDREGLLQALAREGLAPGAVTHVLCSHGHSDHAGNINLFPGAALVGVGRDLSRGDGLYLPHGLAKGRPYVLHPGHLELVATPGHTRSDVTLLVHLTSLGTVAVAGDLFEREEDEEEWRKLSEDPESQERSRRWVLEVADVIVPGHGPPFRVIRDWGGAGGGHGDREDDGDEGDDEDEGDATTRDGSKGPGDAHRQDGTPGDASKKERN